MLEQITLADGLMALVVLLSAIPRLYELGHLPLSAAEAQAAMASWLITNSGSIDVPISSPAYFALTNLFMAVGGSSDTIARLVPAIFGILTVALVWWWRGHLRPVANLVTGLFLAISPLLIITSRTAGGEAIALFALMLLLTARIRQEEGGRGWAISLGFAVGLGLTSSTLFYNGILVYIVASWIYGGPLRPTSIHWRRDMILAAIVTFIAFSTSFLVYLPGLGDALRLFPAWLAQFGLPGFAAEETVSLTSPYLAVMRYEPALVVLGLPALVGAIRLRNRDELRLAHWAVAAATLPLLVMLFQPGIMSNALLLLLPGYLLVGLLGDRVVVDDVFSRRTWAFAGGLILLGMVLSVSIGRFTRLGLWSGSEQSLLGLATIAFVFAGIAVILIMAWESAAARQGIFIGLALMLVYFQWGTGWGLSLIGANDPRERWITAGTDDDVRVLVDLVRDVSRQTAKSDGDLPVFSLVDSPVLRWYFRDLKQLSFGNTLPLNAQHAAVISPVETELRLPNDYFGTDFNLEQRTLPHTSSSIVTDTLKWWLFRESTAPIEEEHVILWLRSDIAAKP